MSEVADETAYYFNSKIPAAVLIAKGVRFPAGRWLWIADATATTAHIEDMIAKALPRLKGAMLTFARLASESDVEEFEQSFPSLP